MKKVILLMVTLLMAACGPNSLFNDKTIGKVDPDLQPYVNKVTNLAIEYNAQLFNERMQYVDVIWSNSAVGESLLNDRQMTEVALTYTVENERTIVLNSEEFNTQTETQKLIVLMHEFYHAVSESVQSDQHNSTTIINSNGYIMPLSVMHETPAMLADYWTEYQDFYLRTFFGLRLDRTWKE